MKEKFVILNNHEDYINLLDNRIKQKTKYIQLVQIYNDASDPVIAKALNIMRLEKKQKTNQWLGTKIGGGGAVQYTFIVESNFWEYLYSFESFFFNRTDERGCDVIEETSFGLSDIAFLDKEYKPLLYTVTHEGVAIECVIWMSSFKCKGNESKLPI